MEGQRLEQLKKMLQEEPEDEFLNYALALEEHKAGNSNTAISILEKLLTEKPLYLGTYYQLGQWYEAQGSAQQAMDVYEKGVQLARQQGNRKAMNELNEVLQNLSE